MEIYELKKSDEKAWNEYVFNHPDSTFFHQIGWKNVVERSYGHKPCYLLLKANEEIRGILPMFLMKSLLFGNKIVSVPFSPYGGAIGDDNTTGDLLIKNAIRITKQKGADYLELRNNIPRESKFNINIDYVTFLLKLDKDPEVVWKGFNNKVRNAIRKSLKSEYEISNSMEDFYNLYSKNMRDLGTPAHSRNFFNAVVSEFKEKARIMVVLQNSEPVSAVMLLYFRDAVISGWAASDRDCRELNPNNLLYWIAIKSACEKGYKFFDFGKSIQGSGTYRFKKPWGAMEKYLQYAYYLNRIKNIPDLSQSNLKRQRFAKVWKALPISLAKVIGSKLRGNFP